MTLDALAVAAGMLLVARVWYARGRTRRVRPYARVRYLPVPAVKISPLIDWDLRGWA